MARQIQGSQTDFSYGEIDIALKRNDQHPARKAGLRQMSNQRILNSGAIQNRSGRRALFPITNNLQRIEKFTISAGNNYKIGFGPGVAQISNDSGVVVATFFTQGNGAVLPWQTQTDINNIVYCILGLSIYITFGHSMRPQVISWNGVSTWSIADYTELVNGGQKRTPFYRISPQGITLLPGARTGSGVSLVASAPLFVAGHVGTRMRYVNRQMLITGVTDSTHATVTIEESIPGEQDMTFSSDPTLNFSAGDVVIGSTSGSQGLITSVNSTTVSVQLISTNETTVTLNFFSQRVVSFQTGETMVGPSGSQVIGSAGPIIAPTNGTTLWDDEIMNNLQGYPASCFVDQFRLGFCNFPTVPGGIGWSAINSSTDLYVGPTASTGSNAIFELTPAKTQVLFVVPGPEGSEFVFCSDRVYYIPISVNNPLAPGSVGFSLLSSDGAAQVQPRVSQEVIIYANAGANAIMAVIATGAPLRPFNTRILSQYHQHLFSGITAIAVPNADGQFIERYAYVLNANNALVVGKYTLSNVIAEDPKIGWGPWNGGGTVNYVSAWTNEVYFTSSYLGTPVCERLDDTLYLDCALFVNAPTAPFAAPAGKGPLWFIPSQTVTLMDQGTRAMGTYQIDANGFIIPQNNGGENLKAATLVAGQPWTGVIEPFGSDEPSGPNMHQRMLPRRISYFAVYVVNSTGLKIAKLFSSKLTPTSPALGAIVNTRIVPAWNQGDNPTLPPPLRESVEEWRPSGYSYDPRVAIIKDTPGPLMIPEIGMEISI